MAIGHAVVYTSGTFICCNMVTKGVQILSQIILNYRTQLNITKKKKHLHLKGLSPLRGGRHSISVPPDYSVSMSKYNAQACHAFSAGIECSHCRVSGTSVRNQPNETTSL